MTYIPYRDGDGQAEEGNWFMSFTNMVPGGIYRDRLNIENDSDKTWKLYMKALPREQSALQDELLEKISMKVWYTNADGEEKLLYTGNATGSTLLTQGDTAGGTEGERAVYLGGYKGGQTRFYPGRASAGSDSYINRGSVHHPRAGREQSGK